MRTLSLSCTILTAMVLSGCVSSSRIEDRTAGHLSRCEVHHLPMTVKLVEMTYGMRRDAWTLALRSARDRFFPHADEVYDTYACCPSCEKLARIYVCPGCTEARARWLETHPQK
jgi:hypothetical protein